MNNQEYVDNQKNCNVGRCPSCNSEEITDSYREKRYENNQDGDNQRLLFKMKCKSCGSYWEEIWQVTGFKNLIDEKEYHKQKYGIG